MKNLKIYLRVWKKGVVKKLDLFLSQAERKYKVGIQNLVYKPGLLIREFLDKETIIGALKLDIFQSMHNHIRKYFKNEKIIKLLEFPILFLGAHLKKHLHYIV